MDFGRFRLGTLIGRGASGEVYEGTDTTTGEHVAIKCVDCRSFRSIAEVEAVQEEIALLSSLRHRYIVKLLEVHVTPAAIYLAMEHAGGGTLQQYLKAKGGGQLDEAEVLRIFAQIFQAVEYCHRRCIVHRDLKPENILLDGHGNVKVADFGLASILKPFDGDVSNLAGTPEFMAPDMLVSTTCDGVKADLWSLGVMLYEALTGRTPFNGPNLAAILRAGLRSECAPLPASISAGCRELVALLLQPDPSKRITLEQALQHPWLRQELDKGRVVLLSPEPSSEGLGVQQAAGMTGAESAVHQARQRDTDGGVFANDSYSHSTESRILGASSRSSSLCLRVEGAGTVALERSSLSLQLPGAEDGSSTALERSSLSLQLPGTGESHLEAVPEEASVRSFDQCSGQAAVASSLRGRAAAAAAGASTAAGLMRGLSVGQAEAKASPPKPKRLAKSLSTSSLVHLHARAGHASSSHPHSAPGSPANDRRRT